MFGGGQQSVEPFGSRCDHNDKTDAERHKEQDNGGCSGRPDILAQRCVQASQKWNADPSQQHRQSVLCHRDLLFETSPQM